MFHQLKELPADPILGLMASFRQDKHPQKVDLGVGVYKDNHGNTPILSAVAEAQRRLLASQTSKVYVAPGGNAEFNQLLGELLLGPASCFAEGRVAMAQTPGGCGALRVAAEVIKAANSEATIWVSDPTWDNHIPLLGNCGLRIKTYPYFDAITSSVKFDAMMSCLAGVQPGDLVLLHGCCHNPCGADLSIEQWQQLVKLAQDVGFVPFVDMAYQGLGTDMDIDAYGLRLLVESVPEVIIASSCSKNFGLYRERVGLVAIVTDSPSSARATQSHMLAIIRGIYSMPPDFGAAVVAQILGDAGLRAQWLDEVAAMRNGINNLRSDFTEAMNARLGHNHFAFVKQQKGMFSFLGLAKQQVTTLRQEYGIYMLDSSRANIAGLNTSNLDYVCDSVARVYRISI